VKCKGGERLLQSTESAQDEKSNEKNKKKGGRNKSEWLGLSETSMNGPRPQWGEFCHSQGGSSWNWGTAGFAHTSRSYFWRGGGRGLICTKLGCRKEKKAILKEQVQLCKGNKSWKGTGHKRSAVQPFAGPGSFLHLGQTKNGSEIGRAQCFHRGGKPTGLTGAQGGSFKKEKQKTTWGGGEITKRRGKVHLNKTRGKNSFCKNGDWTGGFKKSGKKQVCRRGAGGNWDNLVLEVGGGGGVVDWLTEERPFFLAPVLGGKMVGVWEEIQTRKGHIEKEKPKIIWRRPQSKKSPKKRTT